MKKLTYLALVCVLTCTSILSVSCSKESVQSSAAWTEPNKFAESEDGLGGGPLLYKWRDTILAWQALAVGAARCFVMDGEHNCWSKEELNSIPLETWADPIIDEGKNRLLLKRGYSENEELRMYLSIIHFTPSNGLRVAGEVEWSWNKKALLGNTAPNVRLNDPGRREGAGLGGGLVRETELQIPYSIVGKTHIGKTVSRTHFNNGIFQSVDYGKSWQLEVISDFEAGAPTVCRTKGYLYYFALRYPLPQHGLWFSRRLSVGNSWEPPRMITKTFGNAYGKYVVAAAGDTVHVSWLDGRHEKRRLSIDPYRKNYEVAYSHRKDSDKNWSEEILLSEGLLYAYSPTMSVEGNQVVIAWSGVKTAKDGHGEYAPNDIYYVTSGDGGKTWTRPLKLTDGAKDGVVSGKPQVVLLNAVIHIIYVQGKMGLKQESPGLTMLKQPPWPIYYQQRPFPH